MRRSARMLSNSCCSPRRDIDQSRGEWVPLDDVISCSGRVLTAWDLVSTKGEAVWETYTAEVLESSK